MKSFALVASATAFDFRAYKQLSGNYIDENCPDIDKADSCEKECIGLLKACVDGCGSGQECQSRCNRELIACIDSCPCHTDCREGCLNCAHPICLCNNLDDNEDYQTCSAEKGAVLGKCISECSGDTECYLYCNKEYEAALEDCPCMANCPSGCPCQTFECAAEDKEEFEVLILSTYEPEPDYHAPVLVNFNGQVNDRLGFTFEAGTSVYGSCSFKMNNEFWIFGGQQSAYKNQISRIQGCSLIRQDTNLPFDFVSGACGAYNLTQEFGFLCFSTHDETAQRTCYRWNGENLKPESFEKYEETTAVTHKMIRLANFLDQPLAVGGVGNNKVEILENGIWNPLPDYRYHPQISNFATTRIGDSAYIFGGYDGTEDVDDVARLSLTKACPDDQPNCSDGDKLLVKAWFDVGKMNQRRRGHGVVNFSGETMIAGGHDLRQTEYWLEVDEGFSTTYQDPVLYRYESYPEMFVVQKNFCIDGIPHNSKIIA